MSWSQRIADHRKLKTKGAEMLWDRIKILCEVYKDDEFLEHCRSIEANPEDVLDEEVDDTCATFLSLKAALDTFPDKHKWSRDGVSKVLAEAEELRRKKDRSEEGGERRPTWKDKYQELKKAYDRMERDHTILTARFEELTKVLELQNS